MGPIFLDSRRFLREVFRRTAVGINKFIMVDILLFFILPLSIIVFIYKKTPEKSKEKLLNILLVVNSLVFFSPFIFAMLMTFPSGNMWSENGPGAVLWSYFLLVPICLIVLIVLIRLKRKEQNNANKT